MVGYWDGTDRITAPAFTGSDRKRRVANPTIGFRDIGDLQPKAPSGKGIVIYGTTFPPKTQIADAHPSWFLGGVRLA
jgi:hypothetical protein